MGDLLSSPMGVVADDVLYRCLDKLLPHKRALFSFLRERWETLSTPASTSCFTI